ncbi:PilZ domain-containing protein [Pokkaliibacter sp. CJK22405]|uniref:PilZ domain-containing protein n=1 Tax=Pokkaliibacter sp. CJK22405 TaxID=3384615 RepID=UPI003984E632
MEHHNRRRFTRLPMDVMAELTTSADRFQALILDISLHGVLLQQPEEMTPLLGEAANIVLPLSSDVKIRLPVSVVHAEEGLLGCQIRNIEVESLAHLRRLLELNLGEPLLVERELAQLLETNK